MTNSLNSTINGAQGSLSTVPEAPLKPADKKNPNNQESALLFAYMEILQSVNLNHETASIQAKELQNNAQAQENIIAQEGNFAFLTLPQSQLFTTKVELSSTGAAQNVQIPKTVSASVLQNFQEKNQVVSSVRTVFEDQLTVMRQNAQISETNLNTVMNEDQQSVQEGSSLMQMLVSLTNQITRI